MNRLPIPGPLLSAVAESTGELWVRFEHLWTWIDLALFWERIHQNGPVPFSQPEVDRSGRYILWPNTAHIPAAALQGVPGQLTFAGRIKAASTSLDSWYRPLVISGRVSAHSLTLSQGHEYASLLPPGSHDFEAFAHVYPVSPEHFHRRWLDLMDLLGQHLVGEDAVRTYLTSSWPYGDRSGRAELSTPLEAIRHGFLALVERVALPLPSTSSTDRRCRYVLLGSSVARLLTGDRPWPGEGPLYGMLDASGTSLILTHALSATLTDPNGSVLVGHWKDEFPLQNAASTPRRSRKSIRLPVKHALGRRYVCLELQHVDLHPEVVVRTAFSSQIRQEPLEGPSP